jgi:hypothetical protein
MQPLTISIEEANDTNNAVSKEGTAPPLPLNE